MKEVIVFNVTKNTKQNAKMSWKRDEEMAQAANSPTFLLAQSQRPKESRIRSNEQENKNKKTTKMKTVLKATNLLINQHRESKGKRQTHLFWCNQNDCVYVKRWKEMEISQQKRYTHNTQSKTHFYVRTAFLQTNLCLFFGFGNRAPSSLLTFSGSSANLSWAVRFRSLSRSLSREWWH